MPKKFSVSQVIKFLFSINTYPQFLKLLFIKNLLYPLTLLVKNYILNMVARQQIHIYCVLKNEFNT